MKDSTKTLYRWYQRLPVRFAVASLILTLCVSAVQLFIAVQGIRQLGQEIEQQSYWETASLAAEQLQSVVYPKLDHDSCLMRMSEFLSYNPNLRLYILDAAGEILLYLPNDGGLGASKLPLGQLHSALATSPPKLPLFITDPRDPESQTPFAVASIELESGNGYILVTFKGLASRLLAQNGQFLLTRVVLWGSFLVFLAATIVSGFVFYFLTGRFRKLSAIMQEFSAGDFSRRLEFSQRDELTDVANAVNQLADSVVEAQQALVERDSNRRELISDISHDLRSPVGNIQLRMDLIEQTVDRDTFSSFSRHLDVMRSSHFRLTTLVDDLFQLTKLEAQIRINFLPTAVSQTVQSIVNEMSPVAEKKSITLEYQNELPQDFYYSCDAQLVSRLVENLVGNAIQYTPEGMAVLVRVRREGEGFELNVSDSGPGILEENLGESMQRGVKGAGSRGAGLGLAICRTIVDKHKGEFSYRRRPEGGTIFSARFP